jgi:hypothetical protein
MTEGKTFRTYVTDLVERVLSTFLGAALAVAVAAGPADLVDLTFWKGVALAGLAAVVSLIKGFAASSFGDRSSASLSPKV